MAKGTKYESEHLSEALNESFTKEAMEDGYRKLEENWENREERPCGVCGGSGFDPDTLICQGCEGTGKDSIIVYGVEDMKMYSYVIQYGMGFFKDFCKACREAEADSVGGVTKDSQGAEYWRAFALPTVIKFDLMARGYNVEGMMGHDGGAKELARVVRRDYPEFMTTNRII